MTAPAAGSGDRPPLPAPDSADVATLRARRASEGPVFWLSAGMLAVLDPDVAWQASQASSADLTMPPRLRDLVRGRAGTPVSWTRVRSAWTARLRAMSGPAGVAGLAERMAGTLNGWAGRDVDLGRVAADVCTRALVPMVVTGLPVQDADRVHRDASHRMESFVAVDPPRSARLHAVRSTVLQVRAGSAVRREIRGRAAGHRAGRSDLVDPLVDLLPVLGVDRAVDAASVMLSAIAGPPGATAACLLYELARRPDWARRLHEQLGPVDPGQLYAAPAAVAPTASLFVKEVLRMWGPPLLLARETPVDLALPGAALAAGQRYVVSPHLIHRDPAHWTRPDEFDPDRWLPGAADGPHRGSAYTPFGWPPRGCVGAGLATAQLIALLHLLCTRYRVDVPEPAAARIVLGRAAVPVGLHGRLVRR